MEETILPLPRVLWITFENFATEEQIQFIIDDTIRRYYEEHTEHNRTERVSYTYINKFNNYCAYFFLNDFLEFNILSGLNEDGSKRVEKIKVEREELEASNSWADMYDSDSEYEEVESEPLISLSKFKYTEGQNGIIEEKFGSIYIESAVLNVSNTDDRFCLTVKILEGENNFTVESLKRKFRTFIRSSNIKKKNYPLITKRQTFKGYVYDIKYNDENEALITRTMLRFTDIISKKGLYKVSAFLAYKHRKKNNKYKSKR